MNQEVTDRYSIAWFKLADCVARGEKERALGVFRLLSHSLDDAPLAQQLYGDILLSFNDKAGAQERYCKAAHMYQESGRTVESAAVYEHLVALDPENSAYQEQRIALYQQLSIESKVCEYTTTLVEFFLARNMWQKAVEIVRMYDASGSVQFAARLHEKIVYALSAIPDILPDTILLHIKKAIDAWRAVQDEQAICVFVQRIKQANEALYKQAMVYLD